MHLRSSNLVALIAAAVTLAACGGGGGSGGSGGSGSPLPPPSAPAVTLSPASVTINTAGAQQTVSVSAAGYSGSVTIDAHACANIASTDRASVSGPQASFTIVAVAAGQCTVNVVAVGATEPLSVTVTTTTGSVS